MHPAAPTADTPTSTATTGTAAPVAVTRAQQLLAAHVPLSLLLDLADPAGPQSADLLREERASGDRLRRG